jgi:hypothetical protein
MAPPTRTGNLMSKTLRSQNKCKDCGYTWFPRGKNLSIVCPRCRSDKVGYAGPGLLAGAAVLAVFFFFSRSPSPPAAAEVGGGQASPPVVEAQYVATSSPMDTVPPPPPSPTPAPPITQSAVPAVVSPAASAAMSTAPVSPTEQVAPGTGPSEEDALQRTFSDEEIDRMEDEKQYRGDDPIVRARLGLPSGETKKLLRK